MAQFMFGWRRGRQTAKEVRRRKSIAKRHGCTYTYADMPGIGYQGWFSGPNLGAPFDGALAKDVLEEVDRG